MPSIPLTPLEEKKMLDTIGVSSHDDLVATVPPRIRENADFKMGVGLNNDISGRGMGEHELRVFFHTIGQKNQFFPKARHFLGGGVYDNVIPAIVNQLVLRGEFLTCYTPYQPEISQGTLQAIFEFQTMISRITAMPVANASMYDGATATAEAALMAQRLTRNPKVVVAGSLHPEYRQVLGTFLYGSKVTPQIVGWNKDGTLDQEALVSILEKERPGCLIVGYPNYFGVIEPLDTIRKLLPENCLLIVSCADPSALSVFEAPGNFGADIVVGEAHQFGTPMLFGGPHVGFFTTRKEHLRQMPGRLCGETVDLDGKRAYALTLSTREQHIRREKATSNICTNQGLIALRTVIYLSFLGKQGFQSLGETNLSLFDHLTNELARVGIPLRFSKALHYREGVFEVPNLNSRFEKAVNKGIIPGIKMNKWGPEWNESLLIAVHPKHTREDIDVLVEALANG